MKKLYTMLGVLLAAALLASPALADVAPNPRIGRATDGIMQYLLPLIVAIVVVAAVLLVRTIRRKKK